MVKLRGGRLHRSFNFISIGKTLASERITAEEAPPAFLEIEPKRTFGNALVTSWQDIHMFLLRFLHIIADDNNGH